METAVIFFTQITAFDIKTKHANMRPELHKY